MMLHIHKHFVCLSNNHHAALTQIHLMLILFSPLFVLQASLNDSHNQMVVHWAGEKSNVIVALARDSVGAVGPRNSSVISTHPKPAKPAQSRLI